jgi:hypothetical protein
VEKQVLLDAIKSEHLSFANRVLKLSAQDFEKSKNEKWTPGQQLVHIQKSIIPIALGLKLPLWLLGLIFGKSKSGSQSYEQIEARYRQKLSEGTKAPKPYIPPKVTPNQQEKVCAAMKGTISQLCRDLESIPEKYWDTLLLPHPSLGKITLREMMQFSLAHLRHHRTSVEELLNN